jgi:site-specific DNA recombinase
MKKAIGYIRISTKDQSVYSLPGQRSEISKYCEKSDIQLLNTFEENGQSAKNFDRINWQQLESYVQIHYRNIDYLIVYKYDRFSRNLTEALAMIEKLEKKYKIVILSILENIGVHPKSPMFFLFRTQLLLNANNELNYIRERTAFGMHQGAKNGKFLHAAPFGYKNARDSEKKPVITPDTEKTELVRQAFKMYLRGISMEDIRRVLKPDGLKMEGNGAIRRLLSNPTYAGLIKVPSFYDEPEKLVEGKHEPIIDKATWWAVQGKLSGKQYNKHDNEVVPLRGSLHCECGRYMSAGNSKGKYKYYWYYICPECRQNHSAIKLHKQFDEVLSHFSFEEIEIAYLQKKALQLMNQELAANEEELNRKERELNQVEAKLDSVEEKYIADAMDDATYKKWKARYETERLNLAGEIEELNVPISETWSRYSDSLNKLTDIAYIYNSGDMHQKKSFINVVFDNQLTYQAGIYRTLYLNPIYQPKAALLKEKGLLIYEQSPAKTLDFSLSAPTENIIEPLIRLLKWVSMGRAA